MIYKVHFTSTGTHNHVVTGERYCVGKRTMRSLVEQMAKNGCNYTISTFVRINGLVFGWMMIDEFYNKLTKQWQKY